MKEVGEVTMDLERFHPNGQVRSSRTRYGFSKTSDPEGVLLRWRCSCERTGRWTDTSGHFPRTRIAKLWWRHVLRFHPEVEWSPEATSLPLR